MGLKTAAFKKLYEEQYRVLYRRLLAGGAALDLLDGALASCNSNERADTAKATAEAATLRTTLKTRTEALRKDRTING
ncbi:hypothetical protein [Nonomuraea sp. NPDC046570]|uniref:hypothetical protein n=1 Tax=Nonomuraea sp. NPDC046570 TaxID=3155255 RepID=UPI0033CE55F2